MDELLARHRKEQKDLMGQITSMKKQASKKTRKSVNSKCTELQGSLDARHAREVAELDGSAASVPHEVSPEQLLAAMSLDASVEDSETNTPENAENAVKCSSGGPGGDSDGTPVSGATPDTVSIPENPLQAGKKRNRAKERLAKRQAQIDAMKAEAQEEASNSVDYRAIEAESMRQLLQSQGLSLHEIKPDGHCLFSSIEDQILLRHKALSLGESSEGDVGESSEGDVGESCLSGAAHSPELVESSSDEVPISITVSSLRKLAADHIRENPDSYIPYLFDQETMTLRDVADYTKQLEETAMWGSDLEIAALAAVYDCPIKVLVAGSAPIVFNESGTRPQLIVAYFKHTYGLGEHYNSCRDLIRDARV